MFACDHEKMKYMMLSRNDIKIDYGINYLSTCPHRAKLKIETGTQASITLLKNSIECIEALL